MYSSIVVDTDGSQTAGIAVAQAVELAAAVGATLDIVSAYHPVPKARLEAEAAEAPEDVRWAISPTILHVAEEQHADLIVVGNKGMTGTKRFLLGSVPNKISHHARCSVLIIRTA